MKITIPTIIDFEWAKVNFPKISKIIMQKFYEENGFDTNLIEPKNMKISYFHRTKMKDGTNMVDICKAKLRIKMPKDANSFCVEEEYVKELRKIVKDKNQLYPSRGLLIFPVINEKLIYFIDVKNLTNDMIDENFVKDTYASKNTLSHRKQYFIPKEACKKLHISKDIEFEIINTEKQIEQNKENNEINKINRLF